MQYEPINTIPLQQFIQQVKSAENSKSKEVKLSIDQAKNLSFALGIVMSRLYGDLEKLVINNNVAQSEETIEVQIDGGNSF